MTRQQSNGACVARQQTRGGAGHGRPLQHRALLAPAARSGSTRDSFGTLLSAVCCLLTGERQDSRRVRGGGKASLPPPPPPSLPLSLSPSLPPSLSPSLSAPRVWQRASSSRCARDEGSFFRKFFSTFRSVSAVRLPIEAGIACVGGGQVFLWAGAWIFQAPDPRLPTVKRA